MKKCEIKVLTNFNNVEEINRFFAIKTDDVIKYIDFDNNKMTIDMGNNTMIRENSDYLYTIDFIKNDIEIYMKKNNCFFHKEIKTLIIDRTKKSYMVKYKLVDENFINEFSFFLK